MKERLQKILDVMPVCDSFADIGCDHGYITLAMLKKGKCKTAVVSDISKKCLSKAEQLLADYMQKGMVKSFVSNGFKGLPKVDVALIAGMGGEEIISILSIEKNLPETLVLQPMKNADKLRRKLLILGYRLDVDFTFKAEGKFYDIMVAVRGVDSLTEDEILFGRDNLKFRGEDFIEKIKILISQNEKYLERNLSNVSREQLILETEKLKKCLK